MRVFYFVLFGALFFAQPVEAKSNINYDIRNYCKKIVVHSGNSNHIDVFDKCIEEENLAKNFIVTTEIDDVILEHCLDATEVSTLVGLGGSYTLLKNCIDHELEAKQRYGGAKAGKKPEKSNSLFGLKEFLGSK